MREPRALNLAIVIDCSGSMAGDSIAQAKRALEGIINTLQPHDRVTIIGFGNTTKAWSAQLLPCTTANLAAARGFAVGLEADMGGTEIGLALQAAYAATRGSEQADLFVVTDGEVSSWQAVVDEAKRSGRRVFTVGVGSAVSEGFVRALASATGGSCELVSPREGMSDRVIRHFERMRAPRARRVAVHWPEGAHDMSPTQFTAVFEGDTVIATARCGKALTSNIVTLEIETERGDVFRQDVSMAMPVEADAPISTVARLAAAARLHELDREAGLATALRYRLVSAWTNWLVVAVRPDEEKALDMPAIRKVPQTMAAGWGGVGSVMASAPSMDLMACLSIEDSAPSLRRPRRPKALRRLLELIDAHPGRLVPEHAFDLLDHAGLVAECGDLFTKGARLGLDPNAIAAMLLARLLDGPLAEFLPPEAQRSLGLLQDYADAAMAILDEAGHRTHELFRLLETGIKRGVFRPEMLREPDPRLMGLTTCRDLLVQVDEVVRRLGSRPSRPSPNYS